MDFYKIYLLVLRGLVDLCFQEFRPVLLVLFVLLVPKDRANQVHPWNLVFHLGLANRFHLSHQEDLMGLILQLDLEFLMDHSDLAARDCLVYPQVLIRRVDLGVLVVQVVQFLHDFQVYPGFHPVLIT